MDGNNFISLVREFGETSRLALEIRKQNIFFISRGDIRCFLRGVYPAEWRGSKNDLFIYFKIY